MKTIEFPREGENVIKPQVAMDITFLAIFAGWKEVCRRTGKMFWLRNIVISNTMKYFFGAKKYYLFLEELKRLLPYDIKKESDRGKILECESTDQDEWWLLFEDLDGVKQDIIFYSPGI